MIKVRCVTKAFGARPVLSGLDLHVQSGAVHLLVGANGAGKSTLLRIVSGLLQPDEGSVELNGQDLHATRHLALGQLSFLPQAPRFHPRLTTRQVAAYYGRLRGRTAADVERELVRWELRDHARMSTAHLSGGMRQRLGLAIFALAAAPVLVLDEPGLSLDPQWRAQLQQYLMEQAREGRCVLVATHLLGEWEGHVDTCYVLEQGAIARTLPPHQLRAEFLGTPAAAETPAPQW